MFGGGAPQEDMFAKLDAMREIITEVNTQFKDPVRHLILPSVHGLVSKPGLGGIQLTGNVGEDDIRLCLHLRILVTIRNRTSYPGIDSLRDRHSQYRRQPASLPQSW